MIHMYSNFLHNDSTLSPTDRIWVFLSSGIGGIQNIRTANGAQRDPSRNRTNGGAGRL
jgi:hypothetical protein